MKPTAKSVMSRVAILSAIASMFQPARHDSQLSQTAFIPREKSIRHQKGYRQATAIERRRKAKRLSMLSKPKRRAVYYYNLRHPYNKLFA